MKIVHLSDTHGFHAEVEIPDGDVIVHSGDFTRRGRKLEVERFMKWWIALPHKYKILIVGNHDICFDDKFDSETDPLNTGWLYNIMRPYTKEENNHYLFNTSCEIEDVKFYGSPYTPWFHGDRWAFNLKRGKECEEMWNKIPTDTDVLITHGPPMYVLDKLSRTPLSVEEGGDPDDAEVLHGHAGCADLANKVLYEVRPKLHLFGHIHEAYGALETAGGITYSNASICDLSYNVVNKPKVFII